MNRLLTAAVSASLLLGLSACGNNADEMQALRSELSTTRAIAEEADRKATAALAQAEAAAADAEAAAQEARTASEKADRIFRAGLRK